MVISALALAGCSAGQTVAPTTSTTKAANAVAVAGFLAKASSGDDQAFVATYRYLGTANEVPTFEFAQQPKGPGSLKPFGARDFVYITHDDGQTREFLQRDHDDYECFRSGQGRWSCDGPNPNVSVGNITQTLWFDEQTALAQDEPTPLANAAMSSRTVHGLKVTCLVGYRYGDTSVRTTWCIAADGITAFVSAMLKGTTEVVNLSTSVRAGMFSLPARPTPWQGWEAWSSN